MKSYRSSVAGLALAARAVVLAVLLAAPPAQAQPNQLRLLSRSFTPTPGIEPAVRSALGSAARPTVHAIVQFRAPLTVAQHRLLRENGVLLQGHLGGNAYSAAIPRGLDLDRPQVRSLLRWVGQIRPADKLKRPVAARAFETWAIDAPTGRVKLLVQFHPDVTAAQVAEDLRTVAATGERYGADNSWATTVDPGDIDRLAALDTVRSIQQGPTPFLPLNDGGRRIAESDEAQQVRFGAPQPANGKVSGAGVHVGICDSGVDEHHDDFDDVTAAGTAGASRVYHAVAGAGGHGTHVASIAAGSGLNSAANGYPAFSLRGHAPRASVGDYGGFGGNVQSFHDAIVTDHTEVTNHSYVQSMTVYDATAASIDLIVRGDAVDAAGDPVPARPQVWAAGNNGTAAQYGNEEGYYAVFTSAKNSISVGSVDVIDGRLSDFSSLGPTFDGRIKPDLMAPGCFDSIAAPSVGIQAARANSQGYTGMCGTSMAAPVVTGIVADLMEQMQATFGTLPVRPSTYKALLVATAKDQVKVRAHAAREFDNPDTTDPVLHHAGPDFATGFGLVDGEAARDLASRGASWVESSIAATGGSRGWCLQVPAGLDALKVAIAWDDEAGDTTTAETASKLVNDLDLALVAPNGTTFLPWTLDPLPLTANPGDGAQDPIGSADVRPARRAADRRNNVELVSVPLPRAGQWRVSVRGHSLPNGNTQPFSLASTQSLSRFCRLPPPDWCRRFPWFCPRNLCQRYPWICERAPLEPPFHVRGRDWFLDPWGLVPVREICKYVVDCPGCEGAAGSYCPGWRIDVRGLPPDAVVRVIDGAGGTVVEERGPGADRTLRLDRWMAGSDDHFLVVTNPQGRPYRDELKLGIDMRRR